ncbi:MAG: EAL domain-containing protein [Blautia sp.]|nr:EAL domain-containing protein [Blautia sp.]
MEDGMLKLFKYIDDPDALVRFIRKSSFEEQLELDIPNDHMRVIYHVAGKYQMPVMKGGYTEFYKYVSDHQVFPEDRGRYMEVCDPAKILETVSSSEIPGTMEMTFRIRGLDRPWRWVNQVMLCGRQYGLAEGIVECYIYDIQNVIDREHGLNDVGEGFEFKADPLTGLMQKKDFFNLAESMLAEVKYPWQLISIDLEKFKLFNEWYGWENGNLVLARLGGGLLKDAANTGGIACYLGDDDFCLLVPKDRIDIDVLYKNIQSLLLRYGASIGFLPALGIAETSETISIMELYDRASFACELAGGSLKERIRYYDRSMFDQMEKDYSLITDFQKALKNNEITFFLQPQCRASNRKIVGAEALVRWRKKDGTYVPPSVFVPVLEKYNFIADLDSFMWDRVAACIRNRLDSGRPFVPISVNVSQMDIFTIDVPQFFENLVKKYDLPWNALKIEITESACADDSSKVEGVVKTLRRKGFMVLMDDFGSGYSSLNMLHEIEVDVIKIDANFLRMNKDTGIRGVNILESVVNMTKMMGIPIVVEGVEDREQNEFLLGLGCRYMQGFYFYRPMSPADFEKLVDSDDAIEKEGFVFKANEEFRVREFLDNSIYSDSMLNSILGPAAIYSWTKDGVDIIRFNEQFYEMVNVPDFNSRLKNIGQYMTNDDMEALLRTLPAAERDRLNGSSEMMSFIKTDGSSSRFLMHFYYLGCEGEQKRYFGSARDVTQITLLRKHMDLVTDVFSECIVFLSVRNGNLFCEVVAQGIPDMDITKEELEQELNDGTFYKRIVPEQRQMLISQCMESLNGIDFSTFITMEVREGRKLNFFIRSEYIEDETSDVRCIIIVSRKSDGV